MPDCKACRRWASISTFCQHGDFLRQDNQRGFDFDVNFETGFFAQENKDM
jgi:hypothetical protein